VFKTVKMLFHITTVMWNMLSDNMRLLPLGTVLSDVVADFELSFGQTGKHPLERRLSLAKRRGLSTLVVGQCLPGFGRHSGRNGRPFFFVLASAASEFRAWSNCADYLASKAASDSTPGGVRFLKSDTVPQLRRANPPH